MPEKFSTIQFTNYHSQLRFHFAFYEDLKTKLKEIKKINRGKSDESYTNRYQSHIACSYGNKSACVDDRFSKTVQIYLDENVI